VGGWLAVAGGWLAAGCKYVAGWWMAKWLAVWLLAGGWLVATTSWWVAPPGVPFPGLFCFMAPVFVFGNLNLVCIIVVLISIFIIYREIILLLSLLLLSEYVLRLLLLS
jgi:hypothetical protein